MYTIYQVILPICVIKIFSIAWLAHWSIQKYIPKKEKKMFFHFLGKIIKPSEKQYVGVFLPPHWLRFLKTFSDFDCKLIYFLITYFYLHFETSLLWIHYKLEIFIFYDVLFFLSSRFFYVRNVCWNKTVMQEANQKC